MNPKVKELIEVQDEYIKLLEEEEGKHAVIAYARSRVSAPQELIDKGKRMRNYIAFLKDEIFSCPHFIMKEAQATCTSCKRK